MTHAEIVLESNRNPKVWEWAINKAQKDKTWAEEIKKDSEWCKCASEMSVRLWENCNANSIQELAEYHYFYLWYRARTTQGRYIVDPKARETWESLTGEKIVDLE